MLQCSLGMEGSESRLTYICRNASNVKKKHDVIYTNLINAGILVFIYGYIYSDMKLIIIFDKVVTIIIFISVTVFVTLEICTRIPFFMSLLFVYNCGMHSIYDQSFLELVAYLQHDKVWYLLTLITSCYTFASVWLPRGCAEYY